MALTFLQNEVIPALEPETPAQRDRREHRIGRDMGLFFRVIEFDGVRPADFADFLRIVRNVNDETIAEWYAATVESIGGMCNDAAVARLGRLNDVERRGVLASEHEAEREYMEGVATLN